MSDTRRSCYTCLYMATHEKCDDCLWTPEDYKLFRENRPMPAMRYLHWEPGNGMARCLAWEKAGRRNIVIGGSGEAEVNARQSFREFSKHVRHAAEECGYLVQGPRPTPSELYGNCYELHVYTDHHCAVVFSMMSDCLVAIDRINRHGVRVQAWPYDDVVDQMWRDITQLAEPKITPGPKIGDPS